MSLTRAIRQLALAVDILAIRGETASYTVTKSDLAQMEGRIMSAISEFAAHVNSAFDLIADGVDQAVTGVAGVASDVALIKAALEAIENSPGAISAEDQAQLDAALARATSLGERTQELADSLSALDAQTENPPTPA